MHGWLDVCSMAFCDVTGNVGGNIYAPERTCSSSSSSRIMTSPRSAGVASSKHRLRRARPLANWSVRRSVGWWDGGVHTVVKTTLPVVNSAIDAARLLLLLLLLINN